jgi:transcriptional regulator with XRE-family HTH domain
MTDSGTELGMRVQEARQLRGMSLRALATQAGVSSSFLSQLENNKTSANISTIRKLAQALGMTLAELLEGSSGHVRGVLRAADRPAYPSGSGSTKYVLTRAPVRNLEVYVAEFEPGGSTGDEPYAHGKSQEIFVVLKGEVEIQLGTEAHLMQTGDSIEYLSSVPHKVTNVGEVVAEVMWVTSPPTEE